MKKKRLDFLNIDLWVPVRTASFYSYISAQTYVLSRNMKNIRFFYLIFFLFFYSLVVKFSVYSNRHVFVMNSKRTINHDCKVRLLNI